jgi:hypothetical protein
VHVAAGGGAAVPRRALPRTLPHNGLPRLSRSANEKQMFVRARSSPVVRCRETVREVLFARGIRHAVAASTGLTNGQYSVR